MDSTRDDLIRYLKQISHILLSPTGVREDQATALRAMHAMFSRITGIKGAIDSRSEGFETRLKSGLALSPGYAADCLLDTVRTVKYVQALDLAIQKMQDDFPDQRIDILYAGTGPFAPFALAMIGRYAPEEIRFTALDIHLRSLDALEKIVAALALEDYFGAYIQCDATEYTHDAASPPHIVITETMHRTVTREPHAAITLNLAPQLMDGGVFIPERVTVDASMSDTEREVAYLEGRLSHAEIRKTRIDMGTIFELSRDAALEYTEDGTGLVCGTVTIPDGADEKNELVLSTQLRLFGPVCLEEKESGITHPFFARDIEALAAGDKVQFIFNLVGFPELTYKKQNNVEDVFSRLEKAAAGL